MTEPYKKCTDADDSTAASFITSAGTVLVSPSDGWLGPWYFDADTLAKKWSQQRSGAVVSVLGSQPQGPGIETWLHYSLSLRATVVRLLPMISDRATQEVHRRR